MTVRVFGVRSSGLLRALSSSAGKKRNVGKSAPKTASTPTIETPSHQKKADPIDTGLEGAGMDPVIGLKEEASKKSKEKQPPRRQILVVGGNGFVGSAVCEEAVKRGFQVMSMSRSGRPARSKESWMDSVEWIKADALKPETYNLSLKAVQ